MKSIYKYDHDYNLYADCSVDYAEHHVLDVMPNPHFHEDYEIFFLETGNRKWFVDKNIFTLNSNEILLIKPNQLHQNSFNTARNYSRHILYLTPQLMKSLQKENPSLKTCTDTFFFHLSESNYNKAIELLIKIKEEINTQDVFSPDSIKNIVAELLFFIHRNNENVFESITKSDIRLQSTITYIHQNYNKHIKIESCAKIACMSVSHYSREFHRITSYTFKEYCNKIRIDKACELLINTNKSISQISQEVGFSSECYFSVAFKSITTLTPSSYRAKNHI